MIIFFYKLKKVLTFFKRENPFFGLKDIVDIIKILKIYTNT